jgi:hypothetical protein
MTHLVPATATAMDRTMNPHGDLAIKKKEKKKIRLKWAFSGSVNMIGKNTLFISKIKTSIFPP